MKPRDYDDSTSARPNPLAIGSAVLGVAAVGTWLAFGGWWPAAPLGIAGAITGQIAIRQLDAEGGPGRTAATLGTYLSASAGILSIALAAMGLG